MRTNHTDNHDASLEIDVDVALAWTTDNTLHAKCLTAIDVADGSRASDVDIVTEGRAAGHSRRFHVSTET